MKQIKLDTTNPSRDRTLRIVDKLNKDLLKQIRSDRNYQMPRNYINWETLSSIIALALSTCDISYASADVSAFLHSYRVALWFVKDAPIYCLTEQIIEAFNNTDALHKSGILTDWKPSLPAFILALPKQFIYTPDGGEIDYLVVSCCDLEHHSDWGKGKWKHIKIEPFNLKHPIYFQICTTDSKETVWLSGTAIASEGNLIYQENSNLGKDLMTPNDRQFIQRIRNLVINVLLTLEFSPSLLSNVSETETRVKSGGFAIAKPTTNTRYPRWLGKNYQRQSTESNSTHASPTSHWRRGHWRILESGEGKPWKESRRIWIEPTFIN